jgi:hypothetical protein
LEVEDLTPAPLTVVFCAKQENEIKIEIKQEIGKALRIILFFRQR